jgi:hypothetical protein
MTVGSATTQATGAQAAALAVAKFSGIPYSEVGDIITGNPATSIADCSYIVQQIYAALGIQVGRDTYTQVTQGQDIGTNIADAQPGDVIFYNVPGERNPGHEALYLGNNMIFQASHPGVLSGVSGPGSALEYPINDIRRFAAPGTGYTYTGSVNGATATLTSTTPVTAPKLSLGTLFSSQHFKEIEGMFIMIIGGGVGMLGLVLLAKGDTSALPILRALS